MAASIALLCFLLFLQQSTSLVNASVQETCKAAVGGNQGSYEFCVATLSSDPGSGSADTQGLAVIATKLTDAKAQSVQSKISNLMKSATDKKTKECLDTCSSLYSEMDDVLQKTVPALTSKRYFDAQTYLSAAVDTGDDCETAFQELSVKSLLTNENTDSSRLAVLALLITNLLK